MAFDLGGTLRRLKPGKRVTALVRRADIDLPFTDGEPPAGPPLLLDTTVYIDVLKGRAPDSLKKMLRARQLNHSAIALGELTHPFGRLDPAHGGTATTLAAIGKAIDGIAMHRLSAPSTAALAEAGIVTGMIARLQGLPKVDRQPLMNDASLFLQALESGYTLLSRNIADMDLIDQLVPGGRLLLYRQTP